MSTPFLLGANTTAIIVIAIMYRNTGSPSVQKFPDQRLFQFMLLSIAAFISFDAGMCIIEYVDFPYITRFHTALSVAYFVFCAIPGLCWLLYVDYKLTGDIKGLGRRLPFYSFPAVLNAAMAISSPVTHWIFYIDSARVFSRGAFFPLVWIISFSYLPIIYIFCLILRARNKISFTKEMHIHFFLYPLPNIIACAFQLFNIEFEFYGISLLVTALLVFINIQNKRLYTDDLTGAQNRRYVEFYLKTLVLAKPNSKEKYVFAFITDIDNFKAVNDTYGESRGDVVLKEIYGVLASLFKDNSIVARYGGDEFIVLGRCENVGQVGKMKGAIENGVDEYNKKQTGEVNLSLGIGSAVCTDDCSLELDSLIGRAYDDLLEVKRRNWKSFERFREYERLLSEATRGFYEQIYEFDITRNRAGGTSTRQFFESMGLSANSPADVALKHAAKKQIKKGFRGKYLEAFLPENVLTAFNDGVSSFSCECPITNDDKNYHWIRITARIFFWDYDQSVRMITYTQNIDAEKKREMEPLEKAKRLQQELEQNHIAIMLSQIQPHFLYNTLVVIKQLCDIDPKAAKAAIVEFSGYLRFNLDSLTNKNLIGFDKELEHVENYLSLEQKRFGDRIKVIYDIKAWNIQIPSLSVQPVVENAVRYGLTKKQGGGTLTISSKEIDESFVITVSDDGLGFDPSNVHTGERSHVGIENVRGRIKAMCGGRVNICSTEGEGTEVSIIIPKGRDKNEYDCC